jgi:hypothetical protein
MTAAGGPAGNPEATVASGGYSGEKSAELRDDPRGMPRVQGKRAGKKELLAPEMRKAGEPKNGLESTPARRSHSSWNPPGWPLARMWLTCGSQVTSQREFGQTLEEKVIKALGIECAKVQSEAGQRGRRWESRRGK